MAYGTLTFEIEYLVLRKRAPALGFEIDYLNVIKGLHPVLIKNWSLIGWK